ncbi:MAG TPA: DNA mismatch repair endonuclease MutL [Nitrospirota bacterium]|nr:DNA mismatch repair endonuclease MutL [Nitrospirota bacterium]
MNHKIKILQDHVINKIAAGEVVERPASVVKELIENSIDAGSTLIFIDIEQAGRRFIRITDNGCGMSKEDARIAFERHATSKITSDSDLEAIKTMGFRGEALSSIASVALVRMLTSEGEASSGTMVEIEGGSVKSVSDAAASQGTSLEISHLFYNTPARLKFLKSPATEFSHILTAVSRQAMAHPSIQFKLTNNKKTVLDLPASSNLKERAFQLYGGEIAENLIGFSGVRDLIRIEGLLGRPGFTRADKTYQDFYVNRRAVKNPSLTHALYSACGDMLMRDRHPVGFIFIEMDPSFVDVNVHPAKAEVRFRNQSQVHDLVRDVIRESLREQGLPGRGTTTASRFDPEGVREALTDYFQKEQETDRMADSRKSSVLFGRRKSDRLLLDAHCDEEVSQQQTFSSKSASPVIMPAVFLSPLAQIHDSYIITQSRDGMAIIDQHAAHERVLFEKLQDQFGNEHITIQHLLIPQQIELGPAQSHLLSEHLPDINKLGIAVEDFGNGTFVLKGIPSLLVGADYKKLLLDILDEIYIHGKSRKMDEVRDEVLSVMACHPAVKVHRKLDVREMEKLIEDLFKCRMPHTCPHGRPTVVRFSLDDIKKMFKRI